MSNDNYTTKDDSEIATEPEEPTQEETVDAPLDEELAADEKIRQREELLEETAV